MMHCGKFVSATLLVCVVMLVQPCLADILPKSRFFRTKAVQDVGIGERNRLVAESLTLGNSKGESISVGRSGFSNGFGQRRMLLKFDVSKIPARSEVRFVRLQLTTVFSEGSEPCAECDPIEHIITPCPQDWSEGTSSPANPDDMAMAEAGDPTWEWQVYPDTKWVLAGVIDHDIHEPSAHYIAPKFTGEFLVSRYVKNQNLVDDVQDWVDGENNFGWVISSENGDTHQIASREFLDGAFAPALRVIYITFEARAIQQVEKFKFKLLSPKFDKRANLNFDIVRNPRQILRKRVTVIARTIKNEGASENALDLITEALTWMDGCGKKPDADDLIINCKFQKESRTRLQRAYDILTDNEE